MKFADINGFLGTKFGFWLITSMLAGGATTLHAFLQAHFAESQRSELRVRHLDLEIEYRLSQFFVALSQMTDQHTGQFQLKAAYTATDVRALTQSLVGPPKSVGDALFMSMYPKEFGDRPLASLLADLETELHTPETYKDQIAYVSGGKLFEGDDWKGRRFDDVVGLASAVNRNLLSQRWRGTFYYLDCPAKTPFC